MQACEPWVVPLHAALCASAAGKRCKQAVHVSGILAVIAVAWLSALPPPPPRGGVQNLFVGCALPEQTCWAARQGESQACCMQDWVLASLGRTTSAFQGAAAGLVPVPLAGVENVNLSSLVSTEVLLAGPCAVPALAALTCTAAQVDGHFGYMPKAGEIMEVLQLYA